MSQLQKLLVLTKDQGLTTDSSGQFVENSIVVNNLALMVQTMVINTSPIIVVTIVAGVAPEVDQLTTMIVELFYL